jgi:ABC-type sulfate transport system permease component
MALGVEQLMGQPVYPLARTVIGGLTGATLVTLVAVPLVYVVTDTFSTTSRRVWQAMTNQLRADPHKSTTP